MDSWIDLRDPLISRLVATSSGKLIAASLLAATLLACYRSRRAGWRTSSTLLVLSLGLGTIARTGSACHYGASLFLASRCAYFVTLKYINIAPGGWLIWPAWGALGLSAWMSARALWNASTPAHSFRSGARAACGLLAVGASLIALRMVDDRLDHATVELRGDYYHERSRFQPCSRGDENR